MKINLAVLILACLFALSCRLPKYVPPKMMDGNFKSMKITRIDMLPVADLRGAKEPFKNTDYLRKWLKKNLEVRGYSSIFTGKEPITTAVAGEAQLLAFDPKIEAYLGDKSSRFVFLPIVKFANSEGFVVGKKAEVNIAGIIFDKEMKKVIWMNEAEGESTDFMALAAMSNKLAIDAAIGSLMSGLPKARK